MSSNASKQVANAATRVVKGGVMSVEKKYTVQSTGIWERIRASLAIAPERSNGVPLNPQFRNPTPGSNDPVEYDDPVTLPAGDIAGNPYWKRDVRRSYPQLSAIRQADVVGLLSVGSRARPRDDVPLIGEAGTKQLATVREEGEKGLAALFVRDGKSVGRAVLGADGLPPTPFGYHLAHEHGRKPYKLEAEEDQAYSSKYPCRTFT